MGVVIIETTYNTIIYCPAAETLREATSEPHWSKRKRQLLPETWIVQTTIVIE